MHALMLSKYKMRYKSHFFDLITSKTHILDSFTQDPDLYAAIFPQDWRDWVASVDIYDFIELLIHDDLSRYQDTNNGSDTSTDPPSSLIQYIQDEKTVQLDAETFTLIFKAIFCFEPKKPPPIAVFQKMIEYMKQVKIVFTPDMRDVLMEGYSSRGEYGMAQQIERMYSGREDGPSKSEASIAVRITRRLAEGGGKAARTALQRHMREGFTPTPATLEIISEHLSTAKALHEWETQLNVVATRAAWTTVLRNAAETQPVDAVVVSYRVFLARGLVPTPAIIHPIIRSICSVSLRIPTENDILLALELHREYVRITEQHPSSPPQDDLPAYNTLIRAIVSSPKTTLYGEAVSLLEELHARGIVTDFMTTTSLISLLMRIAPDAEGALKVYKTLYKYSDGRYALDKRGFQSILDVFSKECFSEPSHYSIYASIVRDMRLAEYPVSVENYSILLRKLGDLAVQSKNDPGKVREFAATIQRVHNAIALEPTIAPDTILWNQLMDTYQRAGCFSEALGVWDSLFISGRHDNASVSVVADACAYAGADAQAASIFGKLYAAGFPLNERNWGNWVEGLARLGRIDEAAKILCLAMPKENVRPTKAMARTLLTFAARKNMESEVRQRIRDYVPKLYRELYR